MPFLQAKPVIIKRRRISERKFRFLARCFSLDLTATQTAKLTLLIRNTVRSGADIYTDGWRSDPTMRSPSMATTTRRSTIRRTSLLGKMFTSTGWNHFGPGPNGGLRSLTVYPSTYLAPAYWSPSVDSITDVISYSQSEN